jgi:hypothetical protein
LETLLKTLGRWDNKAYPSLDVTLSESMFLDTVITRVYTAYIGGASLDFTQSELESSAFKEKGTGNQPSFSATLQVQWLTTRLRFWDSQSSWEMVNALGDLHSEWTKWKRLRKNFEIYIEVVNRSRWENLETRKKQEAEELVDLTISLTSHLLQATGASYVKQCRVRIGELQLLLFRPTSSGPVMNATGADIGSAISKLLSENLAKAKRETPDEFIFSFSRFIEFSDWNWSEFELMVEPLRPLNPSNIRDLKNACSSRIFLRKLQPQVREWERITIV